MVLFGLLSRHKFLPACFVTLPRVQEFYFFFHFIFLLLSKRARQVFWSLLFKNSQLHLIGLTSQGNAVPDGDLFRSK